MIITGGASAIDILDRILEWFAMEQIEWLQDPVVPRANVLSTNVFKDVLRHFPELKDGYNGGKYVTYFDAALKKLIKDGYIDEFELPNGSTGLVFYETRYSPTIDGIVFAQSGGYQGKINRQTAEDFRLYSVEKRQMDLDDKNMRLTLILAVSAVFAVAYYLCEMLRHHIQNVIGSPMIWVVFVFGIIEGILVYMLWPMVSKRK